MKLFERAFPLQVSGSMTLYYPAHRLCHESFITAALQVGINQVVVIRLIVLKFDIAWLRPSRVNGFMRYGKMRYEPDAVITEVRTRQGKPIIILCDLPIDKNCAWDKK